MAAVTLRVLQGADRGRVFADLKPPITIGREEGNTIQLNDERVSRFHVKIQDDNDRLVLTDLDSTNGTKINGQDCQLRIIRFGDIIALGRSVLLLGNREQIASRLQEVSGTGDDKGTAEKPEKDSGGSNDSLDFDLSTGVASSLNMLSRAAEVPNLPERLSPSQAAQLSELLEQIHAGMQHVIDSVSIDSTSNQILIDQANWQAILQIQARLAELIRSAGEPPRNDTISGQ